jgi:glutamate/tyrosine decarboxylase-like PLP-dependent enzyme
MIQDENAQQSVTYLKTLLSRLSGLLAQHSTPFFSPRYAGHMNSDLTLAGILGYLVGMLYNQNNVTPESGPLTTHIEYEVCQELCHMLGYDIPHAWGHLTSGGSIANLESMW